jgi:cell division protein FtsW
VFDTTTRKPDYILFAAIGFLVTLGLVMVYSASFVEGYILHGTQYYYVIRQSIGALIGGVGLLVMMRIHYLTWRRYSVHILGGALLLLVLVLILPASITEVNNSRAWIRFGGGFFSIQPSEIAKLALIIYIADWLSRRSDRLSNTTSGLIPLALILGVVCGLVMLEPDRGTTMIMLVIAGGIYFAAGANLLHILGAAGVSVTAFWALLNIVQQNARIAAFKDPWKYYSSYGYQPVHALYALASGGFFGTGLGQGRQKFQWLPQAHTDAIYAIIGEELGFIGTLLVLLCFGLIAYRGYRIALRTTDAFASLVAVGITTWIFFQAMINIAVTTSLLPFTGITLPFLSYGGTSLIMCMVSMGVLLNISRHTAEEEAVSTSLSSASTDVPSVSSGAASPTTPLANSKASTVSKASKASKPHVSQPSPRSSRRTALSAKERSYGTRVSGSTTVVSHAVSRLSDAVGQLSHRGQHTAALLLERGRDGWARLSLPRRRRSTRTPLPAKLRRPQSRKSQSRTPQQYGVARTSHLLLFVAALFDRLSGFASFSPKQQKGQPQQPTTRSRRGPAGARDAQGPPKRTARSSQPRPRSSSRSRSSPRNTGNKGAAGASESSPRPSKEQRSSLN